MASARSAGLFRYLTLKVRQTLGLLLPVLLVFSLGQDLLRKFSLAKVGGAWAEPIGMAAMGLLVLLGSPLFVRLAWPSRPLPPGPLRDRLEHLARRFGFRCTNILVLDTGESVVNAGVTGTLPGFYVFLTDALVDDLDPNDRAPYSGTRSATSPPASALLRFFLLGSMAVITLLGRVVEEFIAPGLPSFSSRIDPGYVKDGLGLVAFGLYF